MQTRLDHKWRPAAKQNVEEEMWKEEVDGKEEKRKQEEISGLKPALIAARGNHRNMKG
jgi:hypothetical protein